MAKRITNEFSDDMKQQRQRHCKFCTYYIDGKQETYRDGALHFFPVSGYRHYRFTVGGHYDRIGAVVPCVCNAANPAKYDSGNQDYKTFFGPEALTLIERHKHDQPEPRQMYYDADNF